MEKKKKQLSVVIIVSVLICIVLPTIITLLDIRTIVGKRVEENNEKDSYFIGTDFNAVLHCFSVHRMR